MLNFKRFPNFLVDHIGGFTKASHICEWLNVSKSQSTFLFFKKYSSSLGSQATASNNEQQSWLPRQIYLDYQATTPLDPRVLDKMMPFYTCMFGNPHSRTHGYGWEAEHSVEAARRDISRLINADPKEIIFTSGATESNNLAIKGLVAYFNQNSNKNHIITTQIEHKCLLASCRDVQERYKWDVTYLPLDREGLVNLDQIRAAIRPTTALVSVLAVNNEIGVIQPLEKIGALCKENNILFHTDAAQACGKIPLDVKRMNIDLLSMSAHKIYGPKGIGALYIRTKKPRIRLIPVVSGGGQERNLRSGTLSPPLVVGFGEACSLAEKEMHRDTNHVSFLYKRLYEGISSKLPYVQLNGSSTFRYNGNLNLSFQAVEGESLIMLLRDIALSSGSACTSSSLEPSYVLRAIGVGEEAAHTSLRFGFGRFTTVEEIDRCIDAIVRNVSKLRSISPLWNPEGNDQWNPIWT